jgi:hypothetical protein
MVKLLKSVIIKMTIDKENILNIMKMEIFIKSVIIKMTTFFIVNLIFFIIL